MSDRHTNETHLTVGGRMDAPGAQAVAASLDRPNSLTSGHRGCQGCGQVLGARTVVDAALQATNQQLIVVNATGCLEVITTPFPESAWNVAWVHSLFGNAPAVASGVTAALAAAERADVRVLAQGGDGATVDIGFGCLSGMFDRNDDVLYVCYDNEAYMNTGVQRSGATPPGARTATTPNVGTHPGNPVGVGKNVPRIAMAHGIPYVATASIADLRDLERKVRRAMEFRGARYIHVHTPCPLGWGIEPAEIMQAARLAIESGLFPMFEAEYGVPTGHRKIRQRVPVRDYLRLQKRFAHLFAPDADTTPIEVIEQIAEDNLRRYDLLN